MLSIPAARCTQPQDRSSAARFFLVQAIDCAARSREKTDWMFDELIHDPNGCERLNDATRLNSVSREKQTVECLLVGGSGLRLDLEPLEASAEIL